MPMHSEAGGAAGRHRASEVVLSRNVSEVIHHPEFVQQTTFISSRFAVSENVARVLAEAHFGGLHSRASR